MCYINLFLLYCASTKNNYIKAFNPKLGFFLLQNKYLVKSRPIIKKQYYLLFG